ncbi:hypothetical protein TNCV_1337171 [Trichonephila clavipes]|nr:hypothetical protein TNCV_1337171 [Trichonephila clavipes]
MKRRNPNHWKLDSYLQMKPLRHSPGKKNLYQLKRTVGGRGLDNHILPCPVGTRLKFHGSDRFADVEFLRTEAGFLYKQNIFPYFNRGAVVTPDALRGFKNFPSLKMKCHVRECKYFISLPHSMYDRSKDPTYEGFYDSVFEKPDMWIRGLEFSEASGLGKDFHGILQRYLSQDMD